MKYYLRKSPDRPESRNPITREEIEDQVRTGQIDSSWQARAEGEPTWEKVEELLLSSPPPKSGSAGKAIVIALILVGGLFAIGSMIANGSFSGLFQSREEIARQALENRVRRESNGLIRLVAFEKTNGVEQEFMGMKAYQIEYVATVEAVDDCLWSLGGTFWDGRFEATPGQPRRGIEAFNPQVFGKNPARKGQQLRVSGRMGLGKTENGWRAD